MGHAQNDMKPERIQLAEGIYFNRVFTDKFKTSRLSIHFFTPLTDLAEASRVALISPVLRRGTRTYPTNTALSRRQEELYSASLGSFVSKTASCQSVAFSVTMLRREFVPDGQDLLAPAAELLKEVIFTPLLDPTTGVFLDEYVEGEKRNLINRIRSMQNNKAAFASFRCTSLMHEGEPYAVYENGSVEEVEKITPASLYEAYRALLSEAHIEIYFAGTEEAEAVLSHIRPAIEAIRRFPCPIPPALVKRKAEHRKTVTERAESAQGRLCMGFRTGTTADDPDAAALLLFTYVYACSPTSKLFVNVREKLSLCYSCSANLVSSIGTMTVTAGLENKKRGRAIREILRQLRKMRAGKVTENELMMAKKTLLGQLMGYYDSPMLIELWYLPRLLRGNTETIGELRDKLETVTVKDLARVAKRLTLDTVYFLRAGQDGGEEEDCDE